MLEKTIETYWVKIYISGPIEAAKQIIRRDVLLNPLCVTIEPTIYIYTGGEEAGYIVGLVNYPRFPCASDVIFLRAEVLALTLLEETYQHSVLIMSPDRTKWITKREQ